MYFAFATAGLFSAGISYIFLLKQRGSFSKLPLFAAVISCIGLVCGAMLFGYAASYIHFVNTGKMIEPGLVFYGGLMGFLAVFLLVQKLSFGSLSTVMCDSAAVFIPLFHFFGRIGCYHAACCGGNFLGLPVQLIESGYNLFLSAVFGYLYIKRRLLGRLLPVYFISYSVFRFFVEFLRSDIQRGMIGVLSFSQYLSLAVFVTGIVVLKYSGFCRKKD